MILDADSTNLGMPGALGLTSEPEPLLDLFGGMAFSGGRVTCPVDDPTPLPGGGRSSAQVFALCAISASVIRLADLRIMVFQCWISHSACGRSQALQAGWGSPSLSARKAPQIAAPMAPAKMLSGWALNRMGWDRLRGSLPSRSVVAARRPSSAARPPETKVVP